MKLQILQENWINTPEPHKLENILDNECSKRALEIALVGGHCISFVSTINSPASALASIGARIAKENNLPFKAYVTPVCQCGGFGNPKIECTCSVEKIESFNRSMRLKTKDVLMFSETVSPRSIDTKRLMESEADFVSRILAERSNPDPKGVGQDGEEIMRMAIREINVERDRVLIVAKTIAKMGAWGVIGANHVAEAVQYVRNPYGSRVDGFQVVEA